MKVRWLRPATRTWPTYSTIPAGIRLYCRLAPLTQLKLNPALVRYIRKHARR